MPHSRGARSRTRRLLSKSSKERGLRPLGYLLRDYKSGEKVVIIIDSAVHRGMPYRRFHGAVGQILERRGRAYVVEVPEGGKIKKVIARPEHIRPVRT